MTTIRICDLETTGMKAPVAAPCEVRWIDLVRGDEGGWIPALSSMHGVLCNPSRPIPPEASAVHHIVDEDVVGKIFWPEAIKACGARELGGLGPDVFAAHKADYERQWLTDEVTGGKPWICTYKCALRLWPDAPGHGNQTLRYWLKPKGLERQLAGSTHRALPDAYVTAFILRQMLLLESVERLIDWSSVPALLPTIKFGKHAGKKFEDLPTDYLQWMVRQDFDEDVMHTARHELSLR